MIVKLAPGIKKTEVIEALKRLLLKADEREWLDESCGLKRELSRIFWISTTRGIFSLEELPIKKETNELLKFEWFLLVMSRSLHERTGDISISTGPGGNIILKPQNTLPRGCYLHLSVIAKVVSEYGLPPSGEPRTK
jgi:hypothetical protein